MVWSPQAAFAEQALPEQHNFVWLFRHFVERMDCIVDQPEVPYWEEVAGLLLRPTSDAQNPAERLGAIVATLQDVLVPFGVPDPVMALSCPLGTSALLQEAASLCVHLFQEGCIGRALRMLHLAKLFMLFNFNDWGAWYQHTRWKTDMNQLTSAMSDLTSRTRADGLGGALPVPEPLDFRDHNWKIGLVTYCNYNDSYTNLTRLSRESKSTYAKRHGYDLFHFEEPFVSQAHPWMNKLLAIERTLGKFDWVFWVDCDLFFMNGERTVDSLVKAAVNRSPDVSLLIAEDGMMINSGSFLLRNSPWGVDFLSRTMDLLAAPMPYSFQHMPWHEQAPLMYLALVPALISSIDSGHDGRELSPGYDARVALLPQRALNSYPPEVVGKTGHILPHQGWEDGDLVISFNGCASVLNGEMCEEMYNRYHGISIERLAGRPF